MSDKISSRFGLSVIFTAVFFTIFTCFFAGLAIYTLALMVTSGKVAVVGSLLLMIYVGLFFVTVRYFLRETPQVTIDRRGVWYHTLFARSGFLWEDVAKINLLTTEIHHFEQAEASTFKLRNGEKFVIWVEIYQNGAALRQVIDQAHQLLLAGSAIGSALQFESNFNDVSVNLDIDEGRTFAGNHFLSFRGVAFYGMNLVAVFSFATNSGHGWEVSLFWHILSWAWGYDLFYFKITRNNLVVCHHLFFWYKKLIPLSEVRQCVLYQKFRRAQALKVILKDFRSFNFPSGSISEKIWAEFFKELKQHHIPLR